MLITSARRIREIAALMAHLSSTVFFWDKVILRLRLKFVPKVILSSHINQLIHLPTFYLSLTVITGRLYCTC